MELLVRTLDLETTDFPENGGVPIEAGYVDSIYTRENNDEQWRCECVVAGMGHTFFDPGEAVCSIEAQATHHIRRSDLFGAPHHSTLKEWITQTAPAERAPLSILTAHNAAFEKQYVDLPEGGFWLDTYKAALRLFPDFPRHNNQYLRYALELDLPDEFAMPPHRALPDAYTTAHILCKMSERASLKEMARWTLDLPYLTRIGFGEHFGKKYDDVPAGYLRWILGKADFDPEVHAACQRALAVQQARG